ncbi:MAG: mismatch-specific DNA-glycosylase [Acidobacteria bacterium]|nr:mismatch-specific DNA-glycosylase [Acidobacteriota bacterium]
MRTRLRPIRDRIGRHVDVLFVGINPGVRSAETGHHFAGYSNRFWKLLYDARLVPEPVTFLDDDRLPEWGYGITNLIRRPSAGMIDLRPAEYLAGRAHLLRKIRRAKPAMVAVVGVTVYRALFPQKRNEAVRLGPKDERLEGVRVFVLPNPSGRNANYTYGEMLEAFRALRRALGKPARRHSLA